MNHGRAAAALLLVTVLLCGSVCAAELQMTSGSVYCFCAEDFSGQETMDGIYIVSAPREAGIVHCGSRTVAGGDVLSSQSLNSLTLESSGTADSVSLVYRPIADGCLGAEQTIEVSVFPARKTTPVCENCELETYKNIANSGTLCASDADGDRLTYQLVKGPKRGSVELHDDGSFTYTPAENKVGKDSFVYQVTDPSGNVSNEATVKIKIVKPTDKATYDDIDAALAHTAMWLKEEGIYTGKTVSGHLCFEPDGTVSRGEFLAMTMKLLGTEAEDTVLTSGFADEQATPVWMRPYIVSAFRSGMIAGTNEEAGIVFRPCEAMTRSEAAVMLQNVLHLPVPESKTVFAAEEAEGTVPAWAQDALSAIWNAGLELTAVSADQPITRAECANLLYQAGRLLRSEVKSD